VGIEGLEGLEDVGGVVGVEEATGMENGNQQTGNVSQVTNFQHLQQPYHLQDIQLFLFSFCLTSMAFGL
jgi:hypothetical protein